MRSTPASLCSTLLALAAAAVAPAAVSAQPAAAPARAASNPAAALPASAPQTAASRALPARNPALTAAENAKEPGLERPEERVIPQITVPLRQRAGNVPALAASPATAGTAGAIDDRAARCRARPTTSERAACERALAAPR